MTHAVDFVSRMFTTSGSKFLPKTGLWTMFTERYNAQLQNLNGNLQGS